MNYKTKLFECIVYLAVEQNHTLYRLRLHFIHYDVNAIDDAVGETFYRRSLSTRRSFEKKVAHLHEGFDSIINQTKKKNQ